MTILKEIILTDRYSEAFIEALVNKDLILDPNEYGSTENSDTNAL